MRAQVACDRVGGGAPELFGRGSRRGLLDFLLDGSTVVLNNAHAVRLSCPSFQKPTTWA